MKGKKEKRQHEVSEFLSKEVDATASRVSKLVRALVVLSCDEYEDEDAIRETNTVLDRNESVDYKRVRKQMRKQCASELENLLK